jgi:hypothetical protein
LLKAGDYCYLEAVNLLGPGLSHGPLNSDLLLRRADDDSRTCSEVSHDLIDSIEQRKALFYGRIGVTDVLHDGKAVEFQELA